MKLIHMQYIKSLLIAFALLCVGGNSACWGQQLTITPFPANGVVKSLYKSTKNASDELSLTLDNYMSIL